ncbi:MAG: exodeoxyribonuclease VII small subunit [Nitrosomonas sp.]|nr:exodeoxyribonuclease VII small subunit [Nitrosomonas sp.]
MAKSSKSSATPPSDLPESFEAATAELETIVAAMEAGQMSLEASLAAYKRGAELLQYCQGQLQDAQQQVRILEDDMLKKFTLSDNS